MPTSKFSKTGSRRGARPLPLSFSLAHLRSAAAVCAALLAAQQGHAASGSWLGSLNGTWAGANWSASPVPGTGDTATFNGAGGGFTALDLGGGVTIGSILFDTSSAAAYTIGTGAVGSQTLTLGDAGTITVNSTVANNELFNAALVLGTTAATQTFTFTNNSTSNALTFAGGITGFAAGTDTLAIAGAGATFISGIIANGAGGTVALTKSGAGTLTLSGANTYSGGTTISGGILKLDNAAALNTTLGTIKMTGGTLQYGTGITTDYSGRLSQAASGQSFSVDTNANNVTYATAIVGASGNTLTKLGAGTLTLTSGSSTYSGTTTISAGAISISANANIGTGAVTLNGGTLTTTGTGWQAAPDTHAITIGGLGGTINVAGIGANGSSQFFLNTTNTLLGSGALTLTGSGTVTTTGSGNLRVGNTNTYSGAVTINSGGSFEYGVAGAVGAAATFTLPAKVTIPIRS